MRLDELYVVSAEKKVAQLIFYQIKKVYRKNIQSSGEEKGKLVFKNLFAFIDQVLFLAEGVEKK